jgi:hypothetical protein
MGMILLVLTAHDARVEAPTAIAVVIARRARALHLLHR